MRVNPRETERTLKVEPEGRELSWQSAEREKEKTVYMEESGRVRSSRIGAVGEYEQSEEEKSTSKKSEGEKTSAREMSKKVSAVWCTVTDE